ncbi:XerD/XerC family integrase [Halomicrobium sp. LC1Hm]|nr:MULTISPECIES: site-specific integrase [unclassified Halomicrobium]QGA84100.1 XerD/XerC family integrase [Halomicrobium sp. LC1Hm]
MSADLEALSPERGVEMYLNSKQDEYTEATLTGHKYRLEAFLQWCKEEEIENLNEISGRDLYEYRIWRREGQGEDREPVEQITLRGQLATLRTFLRFAAEVDAVPQDLRTKVPLPTLSGGSGVSDSTLEPERATGILDYLNQYYYASRQHVVMLLLWHTGCRVGGLRALDLDDCELEGDTPGLQFVHRPEKGTPLKNDTKGERWNSISQRVARIVSDYVEGQRDVVTDEYGRRPLITTTKGRAAISTLRNTLYRITRPCWRNEGCPHNRDIESCEATEPHKKSTCPSARSPHDVRSGRVTAYRRNDVPKQVVSDRLNASGQILDKHYDRRGEREKAEQRRDYLPDS